MKYLLVGVEDREWPKLEAAMQDFLTRVFRIPGNMVAQTGTQAEIIEWFASVTVEQPTGPAPAVEE